MSYIIGGIGLIITSLSLFGFVQTARLHAADAAVTSLEAQIESYKARVEQEKKEKIAKIGEANVSYESRINELNTTIEQLRKSKQASGNTFLPARSSTVPSSKTICFDRKEFDRIQSDSEAEIERLINESAKTAVAYQCGVDWANKQ